MLLHSNQNIDFVGNLTARSGLQVVAGNVGIDQANPTNKLEVEGSASVARFVGNRTDALGPRLSLAKSRGSTSGSATIVQDGDEIGQIMFKGADGTDADSTGAAIIAKVNGTPGVNDMPGALTFLTTNDGTNSPTERLRIDSVGNSKFISNARQVIIRNDGTSGFPKIDFRNAADSGDAFAFINGATIDLQTGGSTRLHIAANGTTNVGPQYDQVKIEPGNGTYDGEATTLSVDGRTNDGNRVALKVDRYDSGTTATTRFSVKYDGTIFSTSGMQAASVNLQSSSTNSWFQTGASYGGTDYVWAAKDSSANVWHSGLQTDGDLWLGGNITGTSNIKLNGSSGNATFAGKVEIGSSYSGGEIFKLGKSSGTSYMTFHNGGTNMGFIGYADQLVGGAATDFAIRAVSGLTLRSGTTNRIEITDEGQITLKPLTGGFSTQGATGTYPGAAVSIQTNGIGAGTGTNIPNYGLYVDATGSSNDATLMTGIYARAKQNVEGSAIGIHGLYHQDWNSYARKIGGLFQAPARATRFVTKSFNPGGGMFANTTSTGQANALASGGPQPDGTTPSSATYGDVTALWGDAFRSDTDTSSNNCDSIAIKATNRVTHGRNRTGLMVGIVDGNDTTYNRRKTQFVEYYANSIYQRYYRRNEIKDVTEHYPMSMNSTSGVKNALRSTHTAIYHYQHYVGYNQYSWYFFNAKGSSSARGGRINLDVTWTTGHAAGVGFGKYDILYRSMHSNSRIDVTDFVKYHEDHSGGSYYGWSGSPNVDVYESTSTGDSAGFYLRVQGHISANNNSYDGYTIQSFRLVSLESDYNFGDECSFRFVGNSTPSDAVSNPESRQSPNG